MTTATPVAPSNSYLSLIQEFPLRPLRSEGELEAAIAMIDRIRARKDRDEQENDYLEVLAGLVETYEAEVDPLPDLDPVAALRFLLETNGITQAQLAEQTGLSMTAISEILHGKRGITPKTREALAKRFRVCPSLFA
ncbi:helix-turn-helix domain-containing protein [Singulisphaera acidiphila]|uniref:Putative transcription regulator containing HTH domain n=1 Tax=Singulisphaera acidiphila (strain ATCC BAA-1392 / DSM 18658 / VKM B-2454 / MOB10) TaxID=886293 RepID=L0DPW1_SINAD|nr:helix-turn-helix domain-containing protein [Singulisphaera acidiphila]AGA30873.1 putative transcription regulator containing HTH domain [Singulisphaera acidiphila DSM 18658]